MADAGQRGGLSARHAAALAILDALRSDAYVAERLRTWRGEGRLDARDAALAMEIGLGTLRHLITIQNVLRKTSRFDERRVTPELRCILLSAAYQLIWLDRIPAFAAVDQAVSLARTMGNARASGMVNAMLRSLDRAIADRGVAWRENDPTLVRTGWVRAVAFRTAVMPSRDEAGGEALLAAGAGERVERVRELKQALGAARAAEVAWASQAAPAITLHRNPIRCDAESFAQRVRSVGGPEASSDSEASFTGDAVSVVAAAFGSYSGLIAEGLAHVQDPTGRAAALCVDARPGERILDLCAAPGGKTVVMAQAMRNTGELVACDISAERLRRVAESAARLGLSCGRCRRISPRDELTDEGAFDAALVDAPCSNSGVIARRPEARLRLRPATVATLARQQLALVQLAASRIRPGGRLVYSTCSIEAAENERVVEAFARNAGGWAVEHAELTLPTWGASPGDWRDGGYVARIRAPH